MSRSITITATGLTKILQKYKTFPENLKREVAFEMQDAADQVRTMAVRTVQSKSADEGKLAQSIQKTQVGENWEVSVGANYGPFVEFGTKKRFAPTRGFENYARQFKGKQVSGPGGSLDEAILGWVKRKRIRFEKATSGKSAKTRYLTPEQTAFIIARHISFHGTKAHPYLFPAFVKVRRELTGKIVKAIRRAFT